MSPCSGCTAPSGAKGGCTNRWRGGTYAYIGCSIRFPDCEELLLKDEVKTLRSKKPEQRGELGRTRRARPVLGECNEPVGSGWRRGQRPVWRI